MKSVIPLLLILKGIEAQSPEEIAAALAKKAMEDRVFLERKVFEKNKFLVEIFQKMRKF